jgi:hypothetical protein
VKKITNYILNKVRKNPKSVDWYDISSNYQLPEDFIREFHNKVSWLCISFCQKLSEEFLVEFIDKIDLYWLERNKNVPKDVFERIKLLKNLL